MKKKFASHGPIHEEGKTLKQIELTEGGIEYAKRWEDVVGGGESLLG